MVDKTLYLLKDELGGEGGKWEGSVVGRMVGSFERCLYYEAFLIFYFFKLLSLF